MTEAGYGYWGFSPANVPEGGYSVYGVDAIGMDPNGNPSNEDRTLVDHGYAGCPDREPQPDPPASAYTNGVVTPHAAFLGLRWAPREAVDNLRRLERDFPGIYGKWGFRDTVNVDSGFVSEYYLSLDQGMVMAAIGNALGGRPAAPCLRHAGHRAHRAPRHRRGGVQQLPARLHDHGHATATTGCAGRRATT